VGFQHIENFYRYPNILMFRRVYALEKIHGESADLTWNDGKLTYFPGNQSEVRFKELFDDAKLRDVLSRISPDVVVYGEVYGGGVQHMRLVYGETFSFIAFDVKINGMFLSVPNAVEVCGQLGIEFVPFSEVDCTQEALDAERDKPSVVAERRGMGTDKHREGIVIRPLEELTRNNGERLICKHKNEKHAERATPQTKVIDPAKVAALSGAQAIADEWVNEIRLQHVLDKIPTPHSMATIPILIKAMQEDVFREAKGEIVESKEAAQAIGRKAAELFKKALASTA
jgi:hypothetical protein